MNLLYHIIKIKKTPRLQPGSTSKVPQVIQRPEQAYCII
nr:MAG TPA: hypothetical protein [Caudoviricetes sp.]